MKKAFVVLGVVVGVIVLVLVTGMALPEHHTATSRAEYPASADEVWAAVSDLGATAAWRDGVDRMEPVAGAERETWREHGSFGVMTYEVAERDPESRRLVMRMVGDDSFGGTWTYRVDESPSGATLTITEDGEIYSPLFRFVARFIMGHHGTMDAYLHSLGQHLGHPASPTHL